MNNVLLGLQCQSHIVIFCHKTIRWRDVVRMLFFYWLSFTTRQNKLKDQNNFSNWSESDNCLQS